MQSAVYLFVHACVSFCVAACILTRASGCQELAMAVLQPDGASDMFHDRPALTLLGSRAGMHARTEPRRGKYVQGSDGWDELEDEEAGEEWNVEEHDDDEVEDEEGEEEEDEDGEYALEEFAVHAVML